jgi:hypothetical protein
MAYVPSTRQGMNPIGVSKDGRVIYGPYKVDGTPWQPCDVDVCNGLRLGAYYGYVATIFHPYIVGCWGPGNYPSLSQSCSSNPRKCIATKSSGTYLVPAALAFFAMVLALLA